MTLLTKQSLILRECIYGFHHFCDGTPNKSFEKDTPLGPRPVCPRYHSCAIRQFSVLESNGGDVSDGGKEQ